MSIIFYFRFLFSFIGLPSWGNYIIPFSASNLRQSFFFNYYQYNSIPQPTPETIFLQYIFFSLPTIFLAKLLSTFIIEKLYVVFSLILFGLSINYLSGRITRNFRLRMLALLFFLFNPFMIMILSAGDSLVLVSQSFVLISLGLLVDNLKTYRHGFFLNYKWVISVVILSLSIISYQSFILGTLLYFIVLIIFSIDFEESLKKRNFVVTLCIATGTIPLLFVLILPDLIPGFFTSNGLSLIEIPSLSNLSGNGVSAWNLLILKGYPPNIGWSAVENLGGGLVYDIWSSVIVLMLIVLLIMPFLQKNFPRMLISLSIVFFSFLGAGTGSILFPLNSYLFLHFPGYASLNASYFWDWFILVPLYFLLLITTFENRRTKSADINTSFVHRKSTLYNYLTSKRVTTLFALLLIFVIAMPILSQGYYNSSGINNSVGRNMPASYQQINHELKIISGNSSGGVAFFNPDYNLFFNNTSKNFYNPYLSFPELRTAELQYYGAPSTTSTRYFYWLYNLFYQNQTKYLGALMSLAGIKFFVVLNNTNSYSYGESFMPFSEGKNATQLMQFQYGIKKLYSGEGYSIYQNLNYTGTAVSVSNLTLVAGGFDELSMLPYYGFNISQLGILMSQDLNATNFNNLMGKVKNIVVPSTNSMNGIILRGVGTSLQISSYASSSTPFSGWANSLNLWSAYYGCIDPFAITNQSNALLSVNSNINSSGNYSIYFQMYHYTNPSIFYPTEKSGEVNVTVGGKIYSFNASNITCGVTNSFLWERIQAHLNPGEIISFKNVRGWDELGGLLIVPTYKVNQAFSNFNNYMNSTNVRVYQIISGGIIAPKNSPENYISGLKNGNIPSGQFGWLSSLNSSRLDSLNIYTPIENGTLFLKVLVDGSGGLMNVTYNNETLQMGFQPQIFSPIANSSQSYLSLPFNESHGLIKIKLLFGQVFIIGILIQNYAMPTYKPDVITYSPNIESFYVPDNQNVSIRKLLTKINDNVINIKFDFNYSGPQKTPLSVPLASIDYNFTFPYNLSISTSLNITNSFYIFINSIFLGNTKNNYFDASSNTYGLVSRGYSKLNLNIYALQPVNKNLSQVNLSLNLMFYRVTSVYNFQSSSQIISKLKLVINNGGYSLINSRNMTILRLPDYSLMESSNTMFRYSSISGLNQILFSKFDSNISVYVSYEKITVVFSYLDCLIIVVLISIIFIIKKKENHH